MHIPVTEVRLMYINYANSRHDTPNGYINKNDSVCINSCGTYRLITRNELETCRPAGRIDYQLIYIASGKGYFYFSDSVKPTVIEAGNMVLYHPDEFQKYAYYGRDHTDIYWLHFTGAGLDDLFRRYGLDLSLNIIPSGTAAFYAQSFEQIILELQGQKKFYEESSALLFSRLIMMLGRHNRDLCCDSTVSSGETEAAAAYFHEHYRENINMEDFIAARGYSASSFFRKFRQFTGMTPLQYLLRIRLSNAMKLLETTDFQINEISLLVGYDNALYFSRLFHKHVGVSPREYRGSFNSD